MARTGRYRLPGTDLAVEADVEVSGERIARAAVVVVGGRGGEAAGRLAAALVGAPVAAATAVLADRLLEALDDGRRPGVPAGDPRVTTAAAEPRAALAEAVAVAVRRAILGASDWSDLTFDVVHDRALDPATHMALDQVLAESIAAGTRGPTLRMWEWERPAVVIGSFQSLANEVDADGAARHGITVVRRVSGGGAMFVEPGHTITFSLVVPDSLVAGMSFAASYAFLDAWAVEALRGLGVDARYVPLNDIASPVGKIAGAAQKRWASGAVLHHVTMAYDMDTAKMLEVLRTFRPPVSTRGTKSAQKRVDPLRRQIALPRDAVVRAMLAHFRGQVATVDGGVTDAERERAAHLATTRFATAAWTARVP